jgi:hypothetical protein
MNWQLLKGTGGAMTGHSKLDQMTNGDVLLPPLDCRELRRVGHV